MKVLRYGEYSLYDSMITHFFDNFSDPVISESSSSSEISKILKSLQKDLKFNFILVTKFGFGVTSLYPIVEKLIKNGSLNIELTPENIVLMSLASLSIAYLDESSDGTCKCGDKKEDCMKCLKLDVSKNDVRNILEELKLKGIGNGIIKKLGICMKSISSIARSLFEKTPYIIRGIVDMIGYTSLLVPTMNAISAIIGKYDLNLDTLPGNLVSIGVGIVSFVTKYGIDKFIDRLKNKPDDVTLLDISKTDKEGTHLLLKEHD